MNDYRDDRVLEGEVVTPEQRIRELQAELAQERGYSQHENALANLISNPGAVSQMFNLNIEQSKNVKSLITGGAAALSHKYLSQMFGDELAGAIGGFLGGYISKRLVGK